MTDLRKIFTARVIEDVESKPGYWKHQRIGVFEGDRQIGEYKRNYPNLFNTFEPFEHKGKLYALYSNKYTSTRVMTLPNCKDWCGEDDKDSGFCPVDFYVPEREVFGGYMNLEHVKNSERYDEYVKENRAMEKYIGNVGFVAGCAWGDDSTWKIQYLDLSRVEEKIITRDHRLGYIELPFKTDRLKDAIDLQWFDHDTPLVSISCMTHFDLRKDRSNSPYQEPDEFPDFVPEVIKAPKEGILSKIKVKVSDFITEISNRR